MNRRAVVRYVTLGLVNSAVVYLVFTPYVLLWLRLSFEQYVRWLEGGVAFSLLTGWLFALVMLRAAKAFDARFP